MCKSVHERTGPLLRQLTENMWGLFALDDTNVELAPCFVNHSSQRVKLNDNDFMYKMMAEKIVNGRRL